MLPCPSLRIPALVALALAFGACRTDPLAIGTRTDPTRDAVDVVPAEAFLRNPAVSRVLLSPDGRQIAGLASNDGVQVVFETSRVGRKVNYLAKIDAGTFVHTLGWSGDGAVVVGFEQPAPEHDRERESRMLAVKVDSWRPRPLGPSWPLRAHPSFPDAVVHWPPSDPEHVLVNWWESSEAGASVRRARIRDGLPSTVVPAQPGVNVWYADHLGQVRAGSGRSQDGITGIVVARETDDAAFEELVDADAVAQTDFEFAGFSPDPKTLYLRAIGETGRKALYEYDLEGRRRSAPVFAHPRFDVGALVHSPIDGELWAVEVDGDRPALHFFDREALREQASIDQALPGTTNRIVSQSRAGGIGIVQVSGDTTPPEYYRYDRARKEMVFLFTAYPTLDRAQLAPMQPVRYPARDGLEVPGYLTVPRGATPVSLPVIVIVHDGPSERDHWGWNPTVQFLASRGFAVFQPNYRGSSGYGREHERMGYRQWGLAMQDDLADGVRWLVAEGIADPRRVGIYGTGYGGYAALIGLVKTPELFRAAASFGGVTDLVDLLENGVHYRSADLNQPVEGALIGDRASLEARSPARQAAQIRAPVLIGHGTADPIVHVDQARAMVSALEAAGGAVESHFYRDELHGLVEERNRIDFHERLAAFFERNLAAIEAL